MSYNVHVANGGYIGWKVLERTIEQQKTAFSRSLKLTQSRDYFSKNIENASSAKDVTSDYKLLSITLRAFGLDDDINNKFFIEQILNSDPEDEKSLINKLSDKRYKDLSVSLGFGSTSKNDTSGKVSADDIYDMYITRSFEKNIGEQHPEIELALNAQRELPKLAGNASSNDTKWLQIIGSKPLRKIFEGAFGLSDHFGKLPIDRQLSEFKRILEKETGSSDINQFTDDTKLDNIIKRYLLRTQVSLNTKFNKLSTALALLSKPFHG